MQEKVMDENQKETVDKVVALVNTVMGFIDLYENNRAASIAVTKLEEAVMWIQVMVANCPLKQETLDKINEQKKKDAEPVEGEFIQATS